MASANNFDLKQFGLKEDSKFDLKLAGCISTPQRDTFMQRITLVSRFTTTVTPETTVRQLKDVVLDRFKHLGYEQLDFDYFTIPLSDSLTMKDVMMKFNSFGNEKYLRFTIILPDKMFKKMYKSFRDLGMTEEKALCATKSFMETLHKKESKFDYDSDASMEEIAKKQLAELNYVCREQDKLHEAMWNDLNFALTGLKMSDNEDSESD